MSEQCDFIGKFSAMMKKLFSWALLLLFLWIIALLFVPSLRPMPNAIVFKVSADLSTYELAARNYFVTKGGELSEERKLAQTKDLQQAARQLSKSLKKAAKKYGSPLSDTVENFVTWESSIDHLSKSQWKKKYKVYTQRLVEQLRIASGLYNIDNKEDARFELAIKKAIQKLKENPNDEKRCTVMQKFPEKYDDLALKAKQVAFINHGKEYCPDYYHKRGSWGVIGKPYSGPTQDIPYSNLSYADYYKKILLPKVEKVIGDPATERMSVTSKLVRFRYHGICPVLL